jgi:hypothetical protein
MSGSVAHIMPANGGAGRTVYLREVQGAEGTAATLTAADYAPALAVALTPASTMVTRRTVSPEQPGNRPIDTMIHATYSAQMEVVPRTISAADGSDCPVCDPELRAGGWARTADGTDKTYTYVLQTAPSEVLTAQIVQINAGNTRYIQTAAQDVRGSATIEARAGETIKVAIEGLGPLTSPSSVTNPSPATGSAWSGTLTDPTGEPLVFEGARTYIYDPADATLYGGGSLSSPDTAGDVLYFKIDPTRAVTARTGASAAGGIHGALPNATGATITIEVELTAGDVFTLQAKKVAATPLYFFARVTQRGTSNTMTVLCWFCITALDETTVADSRFVASITGTLLYPPDVSDNSPPAGTSPTQAIGAASNYGLPLMPSTTLPKGLAFIQFATP